MTGQAPGVHARAPEHPGLGGFDYFVLAGAAVNALVIACLIGFWLVAG